MKFTRVIKNKSKFYLLISFWGLVAILFSSCPKEESVERKYTIQTAKNVEKSIGQFQSINFENEENLDLGFYKGTIWVKIDIPANKNAHSFIVMCNDLINRNYRFYKLDRSKNKLKTQKEVDVAMNDHRSFNFAKPNFQINLDANEHGTYYIKTSSDGRILQATPTIVSLAEFQTIKQQTLIFDIIFYGVITILLLINLIYFQMVRNTIYYFYGAYILSSCLMYLFVEGRLYGLGLSNVCIDHLMFVFIRIWILTATLFAVKFLETKKTNPRFYTFIINMLILTLGLTTIYQFVFSQFSISTLHKAENIIGFVWIVLSMTIIGIAYKKRKLESIYYLISYSLFLVFISLGLIDSHFTLLPGDPFSYFKIGTVLEFIGFTYFITVLIKKKLQKTSDLEVELLENKQKLHIASEELEEKSKQLNNKQGINKTDLVGISNILQNSFSTEAEWQDYLQKFKELNPTFLEQLLKGYPNLTKSEIRLLILMKLGYSQKEIASILFIAPDSVKKARSRVRKKMNLAENKNLKEVLAQL